MKSLALRPRVLLATFAACSLVGCSGRSATSARSKEISHLRAITALYFKASSALGKNPENEQEFKQIIANDKVDFGVLRVAAIDDLFISDRDGQPLVIVYGQSRKGIDPSVVAYEQTGQDGIRLVGFKNGQIEEANASRFGVLVPSPQK